MARARKRSSNSRSSTAKPINKRGLQQLSEYLDSLGLTASYILIFDFRASKESNSEDLTIANKQITAVCVREYDSRGHS